MAGFIGQVQQPATLTIEVRPAEQLRERHHHVPATPVTKTLTITNTGDVASSVLTLQTARWMTPTPSIPMGLGCRLFSVSADCNKAIAAGATCSFTVTSPHDDTPGDSVWAGYNVLVEATTTSGTTTTRAATRPADPLIANVMNASALQILPTQSSNTAQFGLSQWEPGAATTFTIKNSNLACRRMPVRSDDPTRWWVDFELHTEYVGVSSDLRHIHATGSTGLASVPLLVTWRSTRQ